MEANWSQLRPAAFGAISACFSLLRILLLSSSLTMFWGSSRTSCRSKHVARVQVVTWKPAKGSGHRPWLETWPNAQQ